MYIQYIQGLFQSRLGTADYALVTSSLHNNDSLVTGTVIHMTAAKFKPHIFRVAVVAAARYVASAQTSQKTQFLCLVFEPLPGNCRVLPLRGARCFTESAVSVASGFWLRMCNVTDRGAWLSARRDSHWLLQRSCTSHLYRLD
jgi:hypothetical protein